MTTRKLTTTARDNHGHTYDVEIQTGDNGKPIVKILGTPGQWYYKSLGAYAYDTIALDFGQNWNCINFDEVMREVHTVLN